MRLRRRLLVLIALLLLGVLSGSLAVVYAAVREEARGRTADELATSLATFRSVETRNYRVLDGFATDLETDASLRYILRTTDRATLFDYLSRLQARTHLDLIVLVDEAGQVVVRSDQGGPGTLPAQAGVRAALEGYHALDYWRLESGLYQVAVVPMTQAGGFIEGALAVGLRIDDDLARQMAGDANAGVAFMADDGSHWSSGVPDAPVLDLIRRSQAALAAPGNGPQRVSAAVDLDGNPGVALVTALRGLDGQPVAWLALVKDLSQRLAFMQDVLRSLAALGLVALLVAMLVSVPLVGRMTNPVALLEKAEAEMAAIFDSNVDGLVALDHAGRVVTANPAASAALQVPAHALVGRCLQDLLPGAGVELTHGEQTWQVIRTAVRPGGGHEVGSIVVLHDVTVQRQADRLKSQVISVVSHELRGPLTTIIGFAELLQDEGTDPETAETLALIRDEAQRLNRLITDLLNVSRLEAGRLQLTLAPVDLAGLLGEVARRFRMTLSERHRLLWEVEGPPPPPVTADSDKIQQVVLNLLSNAAKYSPAGGDIRLVLSTGEGYARIRVEDQGLGIPEADLKLLFGRFHRVQDEARSQIPGIGLGLHICRELVELHGGRMAVTSRPGEGSVFEFSLPLARPSEADLQGGLQSLAAP